MIRKMECPVFADVDQRGGRQDISYVVAEACGLVERTYPRREYDIIEITKGKDGPDHRLYHITVEIVE